MESYPTTILLIEDDEEDVILLQKMLTKIPTANYKVKWESTYASGLAQMLEGQHDLCLLDYRLGAQNGIDLVKEARTLGYARPMILLTGANSSGDIDIQALQAGADDYIAKGLLQPELLHRVIRYAIERKKSEREREKLLSEQIASRELEKRRNEFISMVVHELKTPLTSAKGNAQLLYRRCTRSGDEQTMLLARRIDTQVTKLTELINDFQDVTRITGGKLQFREEYFEFALLVEEILEELQPISEQHQLVMEGTANKAVWGDRMRIGQVITNLLINAIKYTPAADRILVKIDSDPHTVTLRVQDFGPGIPQEQQAHIFEAFYRIERPEQRTIPGLGLGLAIAAEIITRHAGKIWVESKEGQGATFCFTLPLDRATVLLPEEPLIQAE